MPSFFQFTQGSETRFRPADASSPLLGRFRAVPPRPGLDQRHRRHSQLGLLADRVGDGRGSVHVGYGALLAAELEAEAAAADDDDDDDGNGGNGGFDDDRSVTQRLWQAYVVDLWIDPRQTAVRRVVERWWSRYGLLVFLPALLVRVRPLCAPPSWELHCDFMLTLVGNAGRGLVLGSVPAVSLA